MVTQARSRGSSRCPPAPRSEEWAAAEQIGDGEALIVYAPIEPVSLEGGRGAQRLTLVADQLDGGDSPVTFTRR